jgi:hypothetical protein
MITTGGAATLAAGGITGDTDPRVLALAVVSRHVPLDQNTGN